MLEYFHSSQPISTQRVEQATSIISEDTQNPISYLPIEYNAVKEGLKEWESRLMEPLYSSSRKQAKILLAASRTLISRDSLHKYEIKNYRDGAIEVQM